MGTQTLSTPYLRRPKFRPSDFLIGQKQNETRYVPSSLVPSEIEGNIYPNKLVLIFRYMTSEEPSQKKFRNGNVELELGKSTSKILQIALSFKPSYPYLIAAIDDAVRTVKLARGTIERRSIQKSYDFIVDFLDQAKTDFHTPNMKRELEQMFRQKPTS